MKLYIATGNPMKLNAFKLLIAQINPEITVEKVPKLIDVEGNGITLAENASIKVAPYKGLYKYPVLANDAGLYFDKGVKEIQDPTKVKRNALDGQKESELTQEQIGKMMLEFYQSIAQKYGGKIDCEMKDVFSIILPSGEIKQTHSTREYVLTDRKVEEYSIYQPLDNLRISKIVGKYMDEFTKEEEVKDKEPLIKALRNLIN